MNAAPLLAELARRLDEVKLDAVLIGNAAAALQGAPVTTIDFDFLFQNTSRNLAKLKALARALRGTIMRPYYPASNLSNRSRRGWAAGGLHGHDPRHPLLRRNPRPRVDRGVRRRRAASGKLG